MLLPESTDRYQGIKIISKGGFGEVYDAIDSILGKKVIIKCILNDRLWDRLFKIRNLLLKNSSEQIVKIYDITSINGTNCIVQQYVEGISLDNCISGYNLSLREFLRIAIDICKALLYLESKNMVHRDVKASNIIFNSDTCKAVLIDLDFLALNLAERENDFKFIGTIAYSAPEQITNGIASISADIYSLGVVLYQLIQGALPYENNKNGVLAKTNNRIVANFNKLNSFTFYDRITNLILNMICFDPSERISPENALSELESIFKVAEDTDSLNTSLRLNKNEIVENLGVKDKLIISDQSMASVFNESFALFMSSAKTNYEPSVGFTQSQCEEYSSMKEKSNNKKVGVFNKKNKSNSLVNKTYQQQLLKEYDTILFQAKVTFWLWVSAFAVCYIIVFTSIVLICLGRYEEALMTAVLEGLIYGVQRLFSIKEKHYRELINNKIKHLEIADYWDYAFDRMDNLDDDKMKNKKIGDFLDIIRKHTER